MAGVAQPAARAAEPVEPVRGVSIVVPIYNEEGNLRELHRQIATEMGNLDLPFELIVVDDGSTDGGWALLRDLAATDSRLMAVRHRRNFGKARALATGFAVARHDLVVTMDGDLQDDPAELRRFVAAIDAGADLVSGWKQKRHDPLGKTLPSKLFNAVVRHVSGVQLNDFNCGFKAYRLEVVRTIRLYGELHRFTPVLAGAEGFRIAELPVTHHPRRWGQSKYGWSRLPKGFLDLLTVTFITKYRQRPMHLLGLPGLITMTVGILIGLWLTGEKLIAGSAIGGRPLLLLAVLLVVIGAQFFGLGLLGELLAHAAHEPERTIWRAPVRDAVGVPPDRFVATTGE
ncbi:MAG: glycosyltransferase family 2 protein [Thermomicrobiales bacterium]|nr:glycosyltransferase family 2 protein [Thermomicrobiales bacterium]